MPLKQYVSVDNKDEYYPELCNFDQHTHTWIIVELWRIAYDLAITLATA